MRATKQYQRVVALVGSVLFLILAPGTVVGLIPWWISKWKVQPTPSGYLLIQIVGIIVLTVSLLMLLESFARFALRGIGTPAPVAPPQHLVVTGLYRYVRNPMYVAVVSAIAAQSMILANLSLLAYTGFTWLIMHVFVIVYEEPTLRRTFDSEYEVFCTNVPRWIPRRTPWKGGI
jgi:protein-S-isoprenylcysteine O-methyltransferase Ste14